MDGSAVFFEAKPYSTVHHMPVQTTFQYVVLEATPDISPHVCLFEAMEPGFHYSSSSKVSQREKLKNMTQSYQMEFKVAVSRKAGWIKEALMYGWKTFGNLTRLTMENLFHE